MVLMKVNGVTIKNPSRYDIVLQNLASDSSFTSETGVTNVDAVRNNIHTISVAWDRLTSNELKAICDLMSPLDKSKTVFTLEYYQMETQTYGVGAFYSTDRDIKTKIVTDVLKSTSSLSLKLKEC